MNKAVLFDLDGVLIDTEGIYSEFWGGMGEKHSVPFPDFAQRIKGTTLKQILEGYFKEEEHAEIVRELIEFEENMPYRVFEGASDLIDMLKGKGYGTAIVTSSSEQKLERLWAQHPWMKEKFDAIVSDADVERSKPDPQGYLLAAERLGCKSENSYVVEDSYNGLLAGRRSGAKVIALATTNPAETLADKADYVFRAIGDIDYSIF
ncbi:MAG: HAD family phosphatase [Clostridium sp.]|nr:HAD family phosphatase [Clostridium sp.]